LIPFREPPEDRQMKLPHVVASQQFTVPLLMELFERSRAMEKIVARGGTRDHERRILASLFYEPSTRTRFSFEAAMYRLGGKVLSTEQAKHFSSAIEGEQLEDTIRILSGYADVIVLRHHETGGAARAAKVSSVPVINAGDGRDGQHPTQALLDLYTIHRERRALDGLSIAIVGELDEGRTVRSLTYLLSKFDRVKIFFVSPPGLEMKPDILQHLDEHQIWYAIEHDVSKVLGEVDVVYQTRIRPERVADGRSLASYNLDAKLLAALRRDALILHPLPRTVEIAPEIDDDPRALYFRQARNGLFVRMALLTMLWDD
jgi:aspartate carbamoyltransferase catalytic subunit